MVNHYKILEVDKNADEDTIRNSDRIIDIGPKAGIHGGHIVAQGSLKEILK